MNHTPDWSRLPVVKRRGRNAWTETNLNIHDLHMTLPCRGGTVHKKLTHRFQGRDFRLTDVAGNVVHQIIA